jgi:hypothetical protein
MIINKLSIYVFKGSCFDIEADFCNGLGDGGLELRNAENTSNETSTALSK